MGISSMSICMQNSIKDLRMKHNVKRMTQKLCWKWALWIKHDMSFGKENKLEMHSYSFFPEKDTTLVLRNALRLYIKDVPFGNEPLFEILTVGLNKYFGCRVESLPLIRNLYVNYASVPSGMKLQSFELRPLHITLLYYPPYQ